MAFFKSKPAMSPASDEADFNASDGLQALRIRARRRLIGTALLVLLAVVVFPLIFEQAPRSMAPMDVQVDIPSKDNTPARAPIPPTPSSALPTVSPAAPSPQGSSAPAADPPAPAQPLPAQAPAAAEAPNSAAATPQPTAQSEALPEPKTEAKPEAKTDARPESKPDNNSTVAAEAGSRYVLQIGAFVDQDKVVEMRQRLSNAGLPNYIQNIQTPKGQVTRVRVGPYTSEAQAREVLIKLKLLDLGAKLLKL